MTAADGQALVELSGVVKHFPDRPSGRRRSGPVVRAVDGVDLTIRRGETLGLVGESGCGKSTLARVLTGLVPVTEGSVRFEGRELVGLSRRALAPVRRDVQVIFQDPYGSLNPRRRVGSIIGDPYAIHGLADGAERRRRVMELMELVGLNPEHYNRFPAEFSGGQRQRIGIARALALRPKLVVCDEPVSALDVSIQAQVLNLLMDLQDELGLTYLFIAHDLSVVRHVSDRVAVMYLGKVVELGTAEQVMTHPRHPYTATLLSAIPGTDTGARVRLPDMAQAVHADHGCRFHPRCPKAAARCLSASPLLQGGAEHLAACHFPVADDEDLTRALRTIALSLDLAPGPDVGAASDAARSAAS